MGNFAGILAQEAEFFFAVGTHQLIFNVGFRKQKRQEGGEVVAVDEGTVVGYLVQFINVTEPYEAVGT